MALFVEPLHEMAHTGQRACARCRPCTLRGAAREKAAEIAKRGGAKIVERRGLADVARQKGQKIVKVVAIGAQRMVGIAFFNGQIGQPVGIALAKVGIDAEIRVIEWGELIRRAKAGEHDLLFMGWAGDNGDPDNFLTPQFACASVQSGLNFARYCDPRLDKLIAEGKAASSQEQRSELYRQAQAVIQQQALWLPLAHPAAFALHNDKVSGYRVSPFGRQDFSRVRLD